DDVEITFTECQGDLTPEEEKILIEELQNAKTTIETMKSRQNMVVHELMSKCNAAMAEKDVLQNQLETLRQELGMTGSKHQSVVGALQEEKKKLEKELAAITEKVEQADEKDN
ncbi:unnamed protein product, partial [Chrysoparadoxa australica]